jgi:hypothetical protein
LEQADLLAKQQRGGDDGKGVIGNAPVPPYPGLSDLGDCSPGTRMVEPALNKRWKGGISIQQSTSVLADKLRGTQ